MEIRQVRIHVHQPGFRTRVLDLATTLLDPEMYKKADLSTLFRQRWHAEMFHPDYPSSDSLYRASRAA